MGPDTGSASSSAQATEPVIKRLEHSNSSITKMKETLDNTNWAVWRERIRRIFILCGVDPYVYGQLKRPDPAITDPATVDNWDANDIYAQILITNNINKDQMVHITRLNSANDIWKSLEAIHETKDYQVAIAIQRSLFRQCASDGDDITEHLTKLKLQWERLNILDDEDFRITDIQFKTIISSSLPSSWDTFTEPYVGRRIGTIETDPKKLTSSQQFIGILKEEYLKRKDRNLTSSATTSTYTLNTNIRPLADRIQSKISSGMRCRNCNMTNHVTDDCKWLGQPKCEKCGWFGHIGLNCRRDQKRMMNTKGGGGNKRAKQEQVNHAVVQNDNDARDDIDNEIVFSTSEIADECILNQCNPLSVEENDDLLSFYDWLADSATTSHVTNMRDAFTTFQPLIKSVSGVGNAQTRAEGKGTVMIQTKIDNDIFKLTLKDVLYIPTNPQNLLSLGRWDKAGGSYHGGQRTLTMAKGGKTIARGTQINNHLYKLIDFTIIKPGSINSDPASVPITFATTEPSQSWEIWHRRFGHLGLSSLTTLLNKQLVTGLDVDVQSIKYDCEACIQAKQHLMPFSMETIKTLTRAGELTHTDLWGKYPIQSIHGNQYFQTFLDDSTCRPTVRFLKNKDEGGQNIKDYVAYLKTRGMTPTAFRCDQGTEFVNADLVRWLREQGIELQTTAPYSPSQNGAAERLNRTLVELARAMMIAQNVPTFLWEYAIQHAAYLRERAPTRTLPEKTPYEAWYGRKPDVSHLREFGTPVYVLLQPQKTRPKLAPRSKQQIFVGYDDGSKSIRYFNPETRKILTSRNFKFLTNLPAKTSTPEPIQIDQDHPPTMPCEGENGSNRTDTLQAESQHNSNKRKREEPQIEAEIVSSQRKLRNRIPVNYKHLHDPFSDEEDEDETYRVYATTIYQAILGTDDPKTLREAKSFDDWSEWEKAIHVELDQLRDFGTWKLVECPSDAIPIPNKWVFLKK